MKFNIGDKVKIRKGVVVGTELADIKFLKEMKDYADNDVIFEIAEIDRYDNTYIIKNNEIDFCCWMSEEWLVPNQKEIKIKYMYDDLEKLDFIGGKSDWIDLRCASKEDIVLKAGEFKLIPLGVAMELPEGYEAHVVPRSSTFKNFGIIQTNHCAIIDNSYCGDNDWWFYPVYALRDTVIKFNDRICQFRIMEKMKPVTFTQVETLGNADRGGHGSTGRN